MIDISELKRLHEAAVAGGFDAGIEELVYLRNHVPEILAGLELSAAVVALDPLIPAARMGEPGTPTWMTCPGCGEPYGCKPDCWVVAWEKVVGMARAALRGDDTTGGE